MFIAAVSAFKCEVFIRSLFVTADCGKHLNKVQVWFQEVDCDLLSVQIVMLPVIQAVPALSLTHVGYLLGWLNTWLA